MVSMVDRAWVDQHFPDKQMYSVTDFLDTELNVRAANASEIRYDGVVVLNLTLKDGEEGVMVPILVASRDISEPILGYNVIEHLILKGGESILKSPTIKNNIN